MTVALITNGWVSPFTVTPAFGLTIIGELVSSVNCETCQNITIKKGNQATLKFLLTSNGVRLTNSELTAADNIIFAVKSDNKDLNTDAVIYKDVLTSTLLILPDAAPTDPNISVTLNSIDTDIVSNSYFIAVQVNFTSTFLEEAQLYLSNGSCLLNLVISQDVIR